MRGATPPPQHVKHTDSFIISELIHHSSKGTNVHYTLQIIIWDKTRRINRSVLHGGGGLLAACCLLPERVLERTLWLVSPRPAKTGFALQDGGTTIDAARAQGVREGGNICSSLTCLPWHQTSHKFHYVVLLSIKKGVAAAIDTPPPPTELRQAKCVTSSGCGLQVVGPFKTDSDVIYMWYIELCFCLCFFLGRRLDYITCQCRCIFAIYCLFSWG
jgi:hypothetical protein